MLLCSILVSISKTNLGNFFTCCIAKYKSRFHCGSNDDNNLFNCGHLLPPHAEGTVLPAGERGGFFPLYCTYNVSNTGFPTLKRSIWTKKISVNAYLISCTSSIKRHLFGSEGGEGSSKKNLFYCFGGWFKMPQCLVFFVIGGFARRSKGRKAGFLRRKGQSIFCYQQMEGGGK